MAAHSTNAFTTIRTEGALLLWIADGDNGLEDLKPEDYVYLPANKR